MLVIQLAHLTNMMFWNTQDEVGAKPGGSLVLVSFLGLFSFHLLEALILPLSIHSEKLTIDRGTQAQEEENTPNFVNLLFSKYLY